MPATKQRSEEFCHVWSGYETSWFVKSQSESVVEALRTFIELLLKEGSYKIMSPKELGEFRKIRWLFEKNDPLPKVSDDATTKRMKILQEQIKDFAAKMKEVVGIYLYRENRAIKGAIFVKKFDHVDSRIYRYIAKTKMSNPYYDFQIVVIRKKDIVDSRKYIQELSKIADIKWKK